MSQTSARVQAKKNPDYKKSALKSYAWLLAKYSITPTQGPFFRSEVTPEIKHAAVRDIQHQRFIHHGQKPVGRLMKRAAIKAAGDSEGERVTTEDVQNDSQYLSEVEIGNPPQKFILDFDTGSSDLWVFDQKIASSFPPNDGHHFFDGSKSTFKLMPSEKFEIHFGDGSFAKGIVGTDDLRVGGITVRKQAIELAEQVDPSFISGAGDGLLGLGFGVINSVEPNQVATPVENMISQKDINQDAEIFTCKLGSWRDKAESDKGESFYTFGFIDQDTVKATGEEISYVDIEKITADNGWWKFASTSATVNGNKIDRPGNTAIADTGTTLALVDDDTVAAIYEGIPGARLDDRQGWVYPAGTTEDQLPVVTVAVGGKQFVIQKEDLGFDSFEDEDGNKWISGGIQSRGDNSFDILGDTFLKGIYAIFDVGRKRFGAVQRKGLHQNISPAPE